MIACSSLFFFVVGKSYWRLIPCIWALIPLGNALFFSKVPLYDIVQEGKSMSIKELFSHQFFFILLGMMIMAGASEQAMSQWASTFTEMSLGISKSLGDLLGPCFFSILMGCSRVFYAKYGEKISLLGVAAYLMASIPNAPMLNILACGLCGLSVGILWPGIFSVASQKLPKGGTPMFALLALGGDVGCSFGPYLVGKVAVVFEGSLHVGLGVGLIFPLSLIILSFAFKKMSV